MKTAPLLGLLLNLIRKPGALRSAAKFAEQYPLADVYSRASKGRAAVFPLTELDEFGKALLGAPIYKPAPTRHDTLDSILVVPPLYTPLRLKKMEELMREPVFSDVETECSFGGFHSTMPVAVASMGSTPVWNKVSLMVARAAAETGIPMGVGENVATVWGYSKRVKPSQPCFKERVMTYLENLKGPHGGVFIQQSVEDAYDELWNRVYSDPDITPYINEGKVGFEIKLGQGAKPGLGGETLVDRETALRLSQKYAFDADPQKVVKQVYERHSAPGTFTPEILGSMIRLMHNNYPRARVWVKMGPYRDLDKVAELCSAERADLLWVDGKEGGTGLSPVTALKDLGLPLIACLGRILKLRHRLSLDFICSGRLVDGGDIVKVLCFGCSAAGLGRPFVVAAYSKGVEGVRNYLETLRVEVQLLTSAVGKYRVSDLGPEDIAATDPSLARELGIASVYG